MQPKFPCFLLTILLFWQAVGQGQAQTLAKAWGTNSYGATAVPAGFTDVIAVSGGTNHSLALRTDRTVIGWGATGAGATHYGQATIPADLGNVVSISAGGFHSLALRGDGTVAAWGDNRYGQTNVPALLAGVVAVAGGEYYSMALRADGTVVAWGSSDYGVLAVPATLTGVTAIAAGARNGMALKSDGSVIVWGNNSAGQLILPTGLSGVRAVAAGGSFCLALKADGTVAAWGSNSTGQLNLPANLTGVIGIAAGYRHGIAQKSDGTIVTWGYSLGGVPSDVGGPLAIAGGGYHALAVSGPAGAAPRITTPRIWMTEATGARGPATFFQQRITATGNPASYTATGLPPGLTFNATTATISGSATLPGVYSPTITARNASGTGGAVIRLVVTGQPRFLTVPPAALPPGLPYALHGIGTGFAAMGLPAGLTMDPSTGRITGAAAAGNYQVSLTLTNPYGSVTVPWMLEVLPFTGWGTNTDGQLTPPAGMGALTAIVASGSRSMGLTVDGTVVAWGGNGLGESSVPPGLKNVISLVGGSTHALALKSDGTVVGGGGNTYGQGQAVAPPSLTGVTAIAAGYSHSLALKADGTVASWGERNFLSGVTDVVAIAAGQYHSLALKSDGTVVGDYSGDPNPVGFTPPVLTGIVAIAAGKAHSLALTAGGQVISWGNGARFAGILAVPAEVNDVIAITTSDAFCMALKSDGTVVTWPAHPISGIGPVSVPAGLTGVVALAMGASHAMVLTKPETAAPVIITPSRWVTEAVGRQRLAPKFFQRMVAKGRPDSFAVSGLPPGLSFDPATGIVSGAATQPGIFPLALSATNAAGTGTTEVELIVLGGAQIVEPLPAVIEPGDDVVLSMAGTSFSATGLPPGLEIDPQTGRLSGSAAPGIYDATVTASNVFSNLTVPWRVEVAPVNTWSSFKSFLNRVPGGLSRIKGVAANGSTFFGINEGGSVTSWPSDPSKSNITLPPLSDITAIAAGDYFSLALKGDGSVVAWSSSSPSLPATVVPQDLGPAAAIAVGYSHALALQVDGTVRSWGRQTTVPPQLTGVVAIAAGGDYSMALLASGKIRMWYADIDGKPVEVVVPGPVGDIVAIAVAGSPYFFHAVGRNGTVQAWGSNTYGQTSVPEDLVRAIDVRSFTALKDDGTVVAWGSWASLLPRLRDVVAIAGGSLKIALSGAGSGPPLITAPRRWVTEAAGARVTPNFFHQRISATGRPTSYAAAGLPPGLTLDPATGLITGSPTELGTFPIQVSATNAAATTSQEIELTVTGAPRILIPPSPILEAGDSLSISAIASHFSASGLPEGLVLHPQTGEITGMAAPGQYPVTLTASNPYGAVTYQWTLEVSGVNAWGVMASRPAIVPGGLKEVVSVFAGSSTSLALSSGGELGWYPNWSYTAGLKNIVTAGQGYGANAAATAQGVTVKLGDSWPPPPEDMGPVRSLASGFGFGLAVKENRTLVHWGNPFQGDPIPGGMTDVAAVAIGSQHSLILKMDGSLTGWGDNSSGQKTIPPGLTGIKGIAAGGNHSLAIKADGTVTAWGSNTQGQCAVPAGLENVVAVAAGDFHSLALRADGLVSAWGDNTSGQCNVPPGLRRVVSIAAGSKHSVASVEIPMPPLMAGALRQFCMLNSPRYPLAQYAASTLPPGISIHPDTGVISGTPTATGVWQASVRTTLPNRVIESSLTFFIESAAYTAWRAAFWPEASLETAAGRDPDSDGLPNLMEYALGKSPLSPDFSGLPQPRESNGSLVFEMDVPEDRLALVAWSAQFADNLNFDPPLAAAPKMVGGAPPGLARLRFEDSAVHPGTRRFGRIVVSEP